MCVHVHMLMSQITVVFEWSELAGFCTAGGSCGWWEDPELLSACCSSFPALCGIPFGLVQSGLCSSAGRPHTCTTTNREDAESLDLFFLVTRQSVPEVRSVSSPLGEVFKAKAQFVVMAEQLWIIRNLREKDLRHLKGTLCRGRSCYILTEECISTDPEPKPSFKKVINQNRHLVDCSAHTALQHHLKHLRVCRILICGKSELLSLLLHVFNCHLHGDKNNL